MTFQNQTSICCESYRKKEWSGSAILVHFLELKLSRSIFFTCLVKFSLCFLIQLHCQYGNSVPGEFLFWFIMLHILSAFAVSVSYNFSNLNRCAVTIFTVRSFLMIKELSAWEILDYCSICGIDLSCRSFLKTFSVRHWSSNIIVIGGIKTFD